MAETVAHFIGGTWTDDAPDAVSCNPARPRDEVLRFAIASGATVRAAVDAARDAAGGWAATAAPLRGQVLRRAATLLEERRSALALLLTCDEGKTLAESASEISRSIETLHFHAAQAWAPLGDQLGSENAEELVRTVRRPVGVVGAITPFNFPLVVPVWKLAPALVHGNAVVWKPSEAAPALAVQLVRIFERAGLPAGVLNLVQGDASTGAALVTDAHVDAVTFTGSVPAGREVADVANARGARFQVELGGHNAAIVFPDADVEAAASHAAAGAMLGAGQKCTSTRRVIVHQDVAERFVARLAEVVRRYRVGDGRADVDLGPVISAPAAESIVAQIERAVQAGAAVSATGTIDATAAGYGGHFVRPTVLAGVRPEMEIAQEELFGPVTSVLQVADDDEAFAVANGTRFGLSGAVFTRSERRIRRAVDELDVGVLHVNGATTGGQPHAPFGPRRASAFPTAPPEQGHGARDFYTWLKTVYAKP